MLLAIRLDTQAAALLLGKVTTDMGRNPWFGNGSTHRASSKKVVPMNLPVHMRNISCLPRTLTLMQEVSVPDLSPLMDVIEEKQQTGSIIITTQYPIAKWHHRMPDPTMADAICDRLVSTAYKFNLKGDQSMRGSKLKSQAK